MTGKTHYLKIFGSIFLLAGLAFIALHQDNLVNDNNLISKVEALENTPTLIKEAQLVAGLKNLDHDIPEEERENPFEGQEVKWSSLYYTFC
jgi:hypothetical protein